VFSEEGIWTAPVITCRPSKARTLFPLAQDRSQPSLHDIDSKRMVIRVEQGKGRKDPYALLSPTLLNVLRAWWREGNARGKRLPHGWLFPGQPALHAPAQPRLPHRYARRSCRAVSGLRPHAGCLQLLP
jgi:hypothetical protein